MRGQRAKAGLRVQDVDGWLRGGGVPNAAGAVQRRGQESCRKPGVEVYERDGRVMALQD